jgi:hypothetical protein
MNLRSDGEDLYQLLNYTHNVDLNLKLQVWEDYYSFNRPHGAHNGKTPYEVLRSMFK